MRRLFILLILVQSALLFAGHEQNLVEEKLELVMSELERETYDEWDLPPFLEKLLEFFGTVGILFRILFFLFLGALLIFAFYKLMGIFLKEQRFDDSRSARSHQEEKALAKFPEKHFLDKALKASDDGDYSLAILFLHKGSVAFLYENGSLGKGRDYTNSEIMILIGNAEYAESFYSIALQSELILFKGRAGLESEFLAFEKMYRSHFL